MPPGRKAQIEMKDIDEQADNEGEQANNPGPARQSTAGSSQNSTPGAAPRANGPNFMVIGLVVLGLAAIAAAIFDSPGPRAKREKARAADVENPCSEAQGHSARGQYLDVLRRRCADQQCGVFRKSVAAGELEGALDAARIIEGLEAQENCGATEALDRARARDRIGAMPRETYEWCNELWELSREMEWKSHPADTLILPPGELYPAMSECVGVIADSVTAHASREDWDSVRELSNVLDQLGKAFPGSFEQNAEGIEAVSLARRQADLAQRRAELCSHVSSAQIAETPDDVDANLREAVKIADQLPLNVTLSARDRKRLRSALANAASEMRRCERKVAQYDRCVDKCIYFSEYRSDRWFEHCLDRYCPENYRLCYDQRDRWERAGKPRSNVSVPELAFCDSNWSPPE